MAESKATIQPFDVGSDVCHVVNSFIEGDLTSFESLLTPAQNGNKCITFAFHNEHNAI